MKNGTKKQKQWKHDDNSQKHTQSWNNQVENYSKYNYMMWRESSIANQENRTIPTVIFNTTLRALTNTHTLKQYPYFMSLKYIFVLPYIPYIYLLTIIVQQAQQQICTLNQIYTNLRKPKLWTRKNDLWNENLQPNANELRSGIMREKHW